MFCNNMNLPGCFIRMSIMVMSFGTFVIDALHYLLGTTSSLPDDSLLQNLTLVLDLTETKDSDSV